ncbi:MAG: thioesterase [Bacteroidales bacterium]|nr:thioesterase [Bacteroidales bacterium]
MDELTENDLTLFCAFKITSADTDMYMRVKLGGVVNLLIQSAISSAESLGFGFKGLRKQQLYWVLSRLTVEIYHPLTWNQEVEVETWPKTIEGLLYMRDYIIRDKSQNIIARATSGWLAIDAESKRPKLLDGIEAEMFVYLRNKHALNELPEKLTATTGGDAFDVQSGYFDFDLNRHVTSTRYVDWMMDTYTIDFHKINYPKRLSVNFMKETLPGDSINILRGSPNSLQYNFEGTNHAQKTVAFRGKIDF